MFAFLLILFIVWYLISAFTPKVKKKGELEKAVKETPRVYLKGRNLSTAQKFLHCSPDTETIDTFLHEDGIVTMTMRDGKRYSSHLRNMTVRFAYNLQYKTIFVSVEFNNGSSVVNFHQVNALFGVEEWQLIYDVLGNARTVYNS